MEHAAEGLNMQILEDFFFFHLKIPVACTREISQKGICAAIELELPNFFKILGGGGGAFKHLS